MRALSGLFSATLLVCGVALCLWQLAVHPDTPLPREWNPTKRLSLEDPVTLLTPYKLDAAANDPQLCREVVQASDIDAQPMDPLEVSPQCGIANRMRLSGAGQASLAPLETSCAVALRLAMWERQGLQPAAQRHFGEGIARINHFSSYNCRAIRGATTRMSLHATAEAIDVSGFVLDSGKSLSLKADWERERAFFEEVRDSACQWFETTLGPEYNALHADHFHLQSRGWGTCR